LFGELFPSLLSSTMVFCCAERINLFADIFVQSVIII
jgi:hypothetical protein